MTLFDDIIISRNKITKANDYLLCILGTICEIG